MSYFSLSFGKNESKKVVQSQNMKEGMPVGELKDDEAKKKFTSIFDKNQDGTVTVEEQQDALREVAAQDDIIKRAIEKGFDIDLHIQIFGGLCEDIKTNTSQTIGELIVTPQEMVAHANSTVQKLIDILKEIAKEYLQPKPEKTAPTNIGEGWGLEDEHQDYIYYKLQEKGIALSKINIKLLTDIMVRFPFWMDEDFDGIITTDVMKEYFDGESHKYMDKDKQGNMKDTKVLDWIINKYLEKSKE